MRLFLVVVLSLLVVPAFAQESRVVDACVQTIKNYAGIQSLNEHIVQDFSELEIPRVRIFFTGLSTIEVSCFFQNSNSPLVLTKFCKDDLCLSMDVEITPVESGRLKFEELVYLLEQQGF